MPRSKYAVSLLLSLVLIGSVGCASAGATGSNGTVAEQVRTFAADFMLQALAAFAW